jgi:putative chitinase
MDGASRVVTAGLKLQIDSVRDATISQEVAKKKTDAINKATQEMKDRLAQLSNAFTDVLVGSGMLGGLMSGFELISSIVNALVVPAFKILGPVISDIVSIIGFFLTPVFKALGFILNGVADSFVFLRNLIAKPITATLTYLKDLFDRLIKPLDVFGFSFKALSTITDVVGIAFNDLMLNLKEMWYAIKDFIPGLKDATPAEREQLAKERTELSNRRQKIDNMLTNKAEEKIQQSAATARIAAGAGAGMPSTMTQELASKGITDPKAVANIMAQIQAESGFKPQSENLNYSGKKLFEMYGAGNKGGNKVRFKNIEEANAVAAKGPAAVGNVIYGGRMGNAEDEGFKYRGRGMIQLTGKSNYAAFDKFVEDDILANPELVATKYPLASAAWFFNTNKLWAICDQGSTDQVVASVTKRVNGAHIGLQDRLKHFKEYWALLK